ncbi:MarR family transcriptional regulator [Cellulomonas sp. ES6]|uniref:MarR family winged helix-turn-helix transcriptional regulator n=1 Tax=Cellulomonas sp. ES6 TaxID=3039384 RepID=UPI0024B7DDD4|nr:MarR family transcriptional regulator [Cellulomonas sp. ES6]WHP17867.1 MarR family transcriptional regulator [Cellulomonas sp. ES6]
MTQDLRVKLVRLMWLTNHHRARSFRGRGPLADRTRGQGRLLAALKLKDNIPTRDLAAVLGMSTASLNELIGKMVKAGYVTRAQSPDDGRVMLVTLTDAGRSVEQGESPDDTDIFACLTDEEQQTLSGYLDRLIAALSERMGLDPEHDDFALAMEERMRRLEEMGAFDRRGGPVFGPGSRPAGFGPRGGRGPWGGHGDRFPGRGARRGADGGRPDRPDGGHPRSTDGR